MATIWSKRSNNKAPCTIFSTTTLSPRQIANKAYSLGCKKLDRDDKRSKQKYHVRERLLICNTITRAEEVLNTRTRRTNRRVMAAEDEEEASSDEFSLKNNHTHNNHQSPLRSSASEEEDEEEDTNTNPNHDIPTTNNALQQQQQSSTNNNHNISSASQSSLLPRDCRITSNNRKSINSSPIATII